MMIRISTATPYGWGADPWKGVTRVDADDRAAFDAGILVILTGGRPVHGSSGTTLRRLARSGDRWVHRVLSARELDAARVAGLGD